MIQNPLQTEGPSKLLTAGKQFFSWVTTALLITGASSILHLDQAHSQLRSGGADPGGGHGIRGLLFEIWDQQSLIPLDLLKEEAYMRVAYPKLKNFETHIPILGLNIRASTFRKPWKFDTKKFDCRLNTFVHAEDAEAIACQTDTEIRIHKSTYDGYSLEQKGALIIHEIVRAWASQYPSQDPRESFSDDKIRALVLIIFQENSPEIIARKLQELSIPGRLGGYDSRTTALASRFPMGLYSSIAKAFRKEATKEAGQYIHDLVCSNQSEEISWVRDRRSALRNIGSLNWQQNRSLQLNFLMIDLNRQDFRARQWPVFLDERSNQEFSRLSDDQREKFLFWQDFIIPVGLDDQVMRAQIREESDGGHRIGIYPPRLRFEIEREFFNSLKDSGTVPSPQLREILENHRNCRTFLTLPHRSNHGRVQIKVGVSCSPPSFFGTLSNKYFDRILAAGLVQKDEMYPENLPGGFRRDRLMESEIVGVILFGDMGQSSGVWGLGGVNGAPPLLYPQIFTFLLSRLLGVDNRIPTTLEERCDEFERSLKLYERSEDDFHFAERVLRSK